MIIEDCIYAIVAFSKSAISKLPENTDLTSELRSGINGTCFFVKPDEFVTAHHVFNSESFADNLYVIINSKGEIIQDIDFMGENPEMDLSMGKLINSKTSYISDFNSVYIDKSYTAYGFSRKDTVGIKLRAIKKNGKLSILKSDKIHLKTIKYKCIAVKAVSNFKASEDITLTCDIIIFNEDTEVGFSGGPTLDSEGKIIGFTSSSVILPDGKEVNSVIPISYK